MSSSVFKETAPTKSHDNLVVLVGNDGNISVDHNTLQKLLAKPQTTTSMSIVRIARDTSPDECNDEEDDDCDLPRINLTLENYYTPEETQNIVADIMNFPEDIPLEDSLCVDTSDFHLLVIKNDHCYTPLMSPSQKFPVDPNDLSDYIDQEETHLEKELTPMDFTPAVSASNDTNTSAYSRPFVKISRRNSNIAYNKLLTAKGKVNTVSQDVALLQTRARSTTPVSQKDPTQKVDKSTSDLQSVLEDEDDFDSEHIPTTDSDSPDHDSDLDFQLDDRRSGRVKKSMKKKTVVKKVSKKRHQSISSLSNADMEMESALQAMEGLQTGPAKSVKRKSITPAKPAHKRIVKLKMPKAQKVQRVPKVKSVLPTEKRKLVVAKPVEAPPPELPKPVEEPKPPVVPKPVPKKDKKPPAHVTEALFSDMTSLFSAPDIIKKVSVPGKLSDTRKSLEKVNDPPSVLSPSLVSPTSLKPTLHKIDVRKNSRDSTVSSAPKSVSESDYAHYDDPVKEIDRDGIVSEACVEALPSLVNLLQASGATEAETNMDTATLLRNVVGVNLLDSVTLDTDRVLSINTITDIPDPGPLSTGSLDMEENALLETLPDIPDVTDDFLNHVVKTLSYNKDLQEYIDKEVLGTSALGNVPAPVTPKPRPKPEESPFMKLAQQKAASKEAAAQPKKGPVQIVRNGRIITLPPIEAPATRSKKRSMAASNSPSVSTPTAPDMSPVPVIPPVITEDAVKKQELSPGIKRRAVSPAVKKQTPKKPVEEVAQRRSRSTSTASKAAPTVEEDNLDDSDDESWQSEDDPDRLWCICKQPHNNRFMICCDKCEDWFHGKCVNITKAIGQNMDEQGIEWNCPNCIKKMAQEKNTKGSSPQPVADNLPEEPIEDEPAVQFPKASGQNTVVSSGTNCIVCKKEARPSSIYCSDSCILRHAQESLNTVGATATQNRAGGAKAVVTLKGKPEDRRVIVMSRHDGQYLAGDSAPKMSNLKQWLQDNPLYEVVQKLRDRDPNQTKKSVMTLLKPNTQPKQMSVSQKVGGRVPTYVKVGNDKKIIFVQPAQGDTKQVRSTKFIIAQPQTPVQTKSSGAGGGQQTQKPGAVKKLMATPQKQNTTSLKQIETPQKSVLISQKQMSNSQKQTPNSQKQILTTQKQTGNPPKQSVISQKQMVTPQKQTVTPQKPGTKQVAQSGGEKKSAQTKTVVKAPSPKAKPTASEPIRANVQRVMKAQLLARVKESKETVKLTDEEVESFVNEMEKELYNLFKDTGAKYRAKYRALLFNIRDQKNLTLFRKICDGHITPKVLVRLSHDELASQELADWREKEAKHQLEMIKKSELDLLACAKTYVLKTHKGEEVIESRISDMTEVDPNIAVEDVVTALNNSTVSSTSEQLVDPPMTPSIKDRYRERRDRSRSRERRAQRSRTKRSHSDKTKSSHSKEKSGSHYKSRDKDKEREREKKRDRSRRRKKGKRESRNSRSRSVDKHSGKDKEPEKRDIGKRNDTSKSVKIKNKNASKDKDTGVVLKDTQISSSLPIDMKVTVNQDVCTDDLIADIVAPLPPIISEPEASGTSFEEPMAKDLRTPGGESDQEPSSTVTIPTPEFSESEGSSVSLHGDKSPPEQEELVWKGLVNMIDVAQFSITAHELSGEFREICRDLPKSLDIVGRISPVTVWDYISKIRNSSTKDIAVIKLVAANDVEKMPYIALFSYLSTRNRLGVIKNNSSAIKDFYLFPLQAEKPIPPVLLSLIKSGLDETSSRPHLLLGIIVRSRRKRVAVGYSTKSSLAVGTPPKVSRRSPSRSYTPPMGSKEGYTPPTSPRPHTKKSEARLKVSMLTASVKEKIAASLASADDEPYSPGGSDSGDDCKEESLPSTPITPGKPPEGLSSPADNDLQRRMDELNRKIAEQKMEIQSMSEGLGAQDDEEPYSPSRPVSPEERSIPALANINLPSNLQEILASIQRVPTLPKQLFPQGTPPRVGAPLYDEEYTPTAPNLYTTKQQDSPSTSKLPGLNLNLGITNLMNQANVINMLPIKEPVPKFISNVDHKAPNEKVFKSTTRDVDDRMYSGNSKQTDFDERVAYNVLDVDERHINRTGACASTSAIKCNKGTSKLAQLSEAELMSMVPDDALTGAYTNDKMHRTPSMLEDIPVPPPPTVISSGPVLYGPPPNVPPPSILMHIPPPTLKKIPSLVQQQPPMLKKIPSLVQQQPPPPGMEDFIE